MEVHYSCHTPNSMKDLLCKYNFAMLRYVKAGDLPFYLNSIKFIIGVDNEGWIHAIVNKRSIFDNLELQLFATVKMKTLRENLKTPV